jgi:hypothetical protein
VHSGLAPLDDDVDEQLGDECQGKWFHKEMKNYEEMRTSNAHLQADSATFLIARISHSDCGMQKCRRAVGLEGLETG